MEKSVNRHTGDIKIAYICLCHTDPDFVAHTAAELNYKNDRVYIHVDKNSDILPFHKKCVGLTNVHFVSEEKRVRTFWGGYNAIVATINTIMLAMSTDNYDRFVLLQGQDYPLFSNEYIHTFFRTHQETEFCKAENISQSKIKADYIKCGCYWHLDNINLFWRLIHKINHIGIKYRPVIFKNSDKRWEVYHGWAQWALTRECIEYVLDIYQKEGAFNKFIKHRFPPDELYFPTVIYNSNFKDNLWRETIYNRHGRKTKLNLTYFEYPDKVVVFTDPQDYEHLKKTGCLFVRKVNSESKALIKKIDREISEKQTSEQCFS